MNISQFEELKPIKNPFNKYAGFGGILFETIGEELEFIKKQNPKKIWTYIDGDNNDIILVSGYQYINRIGYAITQEPFLGDFFELNLGQ